MRMLLLITLALASLSAGEPLPRPTLDELIVGAQAFALAQQEADGALSPAGMFPLGITAFALDGLISGPHALPATHPAVAAAVAYLARHRQGDGGVYDPVEGLGVYGTSLTLQALMKLPSAARGDVPIEPLQAYLFAAQNPTPGDLGQGGIGYGDKGRGFEDLSNTAYAVQALHATGIPADDPRMQMALAFLERCQDLSAVNRQPWVTNSGGGVYGPQEASRSWAKGDEIQAPRWTPTGGMTYALLSSYLTLDLKPDDQRVRAALAWLTANYGFAANPGMGPGKEAQGLFHTYALAATTFDLLAQPTLTLGDGRAADWRRDLVAALAERVVPVTLAGNVQGYSWVNSAPRWAEGQPSLCTAYALRALKAAARSLAQAP